MPFITVSLNNFRNLKNGRIDLRNKEIYFVGENGQGKSNLLESLYYASYGSSFRTHVDSQIIKKGTQSFSLSALYEQESNSAQKIDISYDGAKKLISKNGKRIQDRKELINTIPCVLFCHSDMEFATGAPEFRRFFIDQSLTMFNPLYLDDMRNYKKILRNRNTLLKEKKYDLLDIFDVQLANTGLEVQKKRKEVIFQFNQIFTQLYQDISDISGLRIAYYPSWKELPDEVGTRFPTVDDVLKVLKEKREQDKVIETTMSGPHRDRIVFMHEGSQFIPSASTGQQRLVALLLRVAQAVYYHRVTGKKPVFLMDDVMLELDPNKRQKLTSMLPDYDQLFCTFLPGEPYERYKRSTTKIYHVANGEILEAHA